MTARMPLKGGKVNFCSHLVPQVFIPYCASFMNQVTFKSSVTGLSLFGFTWLKETSGGETLTTQFSHVFISYVCANQLRIHI